MPKPGPGNNLDKTLSKKRVDLVLNGVAGNEHLGRFSAQDIFNAVALVLEQKIKNKAEERKHILKSHIYESLPEELLSCGEKMIEEVGFQAIQDMLLGGQLKLSGHEDYLDPGREIGWGSFVTYMTYMTYM